MFIFYLFRFYVCLVVCCCFLGGGGSYCNFLQNQTLYESYYLFFCNSIIICSWYLITWKMFGYYCLFATLNYKDGEAHNNDDGTSDWVYHPAKWRFKLLNTCSRYLIISCKCIWYIRFNLNAFNFHNFNRNT